MYDVTADQARAMSDGYLVFWTDIGETFGLGFKTPSPAGLFFHDRRTIINPWAFFHIPVRQQPDPPGLEETAVKLFAQFEGNDVG